MTSHEVLQTAYAAAALVAETGDAAELLEPLSHTELVRVACVLAAILAGQTDLMRERLDLPGGVTGTVEMLRRFAADEAREGT